MKTSGLIIEMSVQEGAVLAGLLSNLVKYVGLDDKGVTANNCSFYIKKLDEAANEYEARRIEEANKKTETSVPTLSDEQKKRREELTQQIDQEAKEALESKGE